MEQFTIYKNGTKVSTTGDTAFEVTGLQSDTEYTLGVSRVIDGRESDIATIKARTSPKDMSDLTVPEIKQALDEQGIEYTSDMRKAELLKLLT